METPETPKTRKLLVIPDDAVITVQMSGFYIKNIQSILIAIAEQMGKDNLSKILEKMRGDSPPENVDEALIYSLIALIDSAESAAKEQGKTKIEEYTEDQLRKIIEDLDS